MTGLTRGQIAQQRIEERPYRFEPEKPAMNAKAAGLRERAEAIVKILAAIAAETDPDNLRTIRGRARAMESKKVADAALHRLAEILSREQPGTVEHEFWRSVYATEQVISEARGEIITLLQTKLMVAKIGERAMLERWVLKNGGSEGFTILLGLGMPELTGEAVVIRHAGDFAPYVVAAARVKFVNAGVDPDSLSLP
jgi:hypothetical protein